MGSSRPWRLGRLHTFTNRCEGLLPGSDNEMPASIGYLKEYQPSGMWLIAGDDLQYDIGTTAKGEEGQWRIRFRKDYCRIKMASSGMLRRVALVRTDLSEELSASIIRVTRIGELGTLAVTSNRRTPLICITINGFPDFVPCFRLIYSTVKTLYIVRTRKFAYAFGMQDQTFLSCDWRHMKKFLVIKQLSRKC
jgi:hypothetical protein